jgi:hypothetical protein
MSDTVWAAIIAVSGALITSLIAAILQIKITRRVTEGARETAVIQTKVNNRLELESRRKENIVDLISDLVSMIDPSADQPFNRRRVVSLVNRIQLRLNRKNDLERAINGYLNNICFIVDDSSSKLENPTITLLGEQGKLTDAVWAWYNS